MPRKPTVDLLGQTFGALTIIGAERIGDRRQWRCQCVCGSARMATTGQLKSGLARSCGCKTRENRLRSRTTHGEGSSKGVRTKEYRTWAHIRGRCVNPTDAAWKYYGGRGIQICERWRDSFESFLADMGRAPSAKHSIDRIDVNGHYEPNNCRWTTADVQAKNQRRHIGKSFYRAMLAAATRNSASDKGPS